MARRVKRGEDPTPAPLAPDASGLDAPEPPLGLRGQARVAPTPAEDPPTPLAADTAVAEPTVTLDTPAGEATETIPGIGAAELTPPEAEDWLGAVDPLSAPDLTLRRVVPVRRDWKSSFRQDTPSRFTSLWSATEPPREPAAEPPDDPDADPATERSDGATGPGSEVGVALPPDPASALRPLDPTAPAEAVPPEDPGFDPPSDPLSGLRPPPPPLPPPPGAPGEHPAPHEAGPAAEPPAESGPAAAPEPAPEAADKPTLAPPAEAPAPTPRAEATPPAAAPAPSPPAEALSPAAPAPPPRPGAAPARDRETAPQPGPADRATLPSPPPMAAARSADRWAERPPLLLAVVAGIVVLGLGVAIGAAVHALMSSRQAQPDLPPVEPYQPAAVTPTTPPAATPAPVEAAPTEAPPTEASPLEPAAGATTPAAGATTGTKRPKATPTEKLDEVAEPAEADPWGAAEASPTGDEATEKKRGGKRKPKDEAAP